jgi:hypothetical protein
MHIINSPWDKSDDLHNTNSLQFGVLHHIWIIQEMQTSIDLDYIHIASFSCRSHQMNRPPYSHMLYHQAYIVDIFIDMSKLVVKRQTSIVYKQISPYSPSTSLLIKHCFISINCTICRGVNWSKKCIFIHRHICSTINEYTNPMDR